MQIRRFSDDATIAVIELDAELTERQAPALTSEAQGLIAGGVQAVIVDCSKLAHLSSFGLSVLLRLRKEWRDQFGEEGERVVLAGVSRQIATLLKVTHLDRLFAVYQDAAEAGTAMRKASGAKGGASGSGAAGENKKARQSRVAK